MWRTQLQRRVEFGRCLCKLVISAPLVLGAALLLPLGAGLGVSLEVSAALTPVHLRCEYLVDPLAVDSEQPRLSWELESPQREQKQAAYQILTATSVEKLDRGEADLWDSGKVPSDQSIQIAYAGRSLASRQQVFWKVRAWRTSND